MRSKRVKRASIAINLLRQIDYEKLRFTINFIILAVFAFAAIGVVSKTGRYPWGSDTYGHLFKANILYEGLINGKYFANYNESWYNGVQPFRYWAPLSYYILAVINVFTRDIFAAYKAFMVFTFIVGGLGWLMWGSFVKRHNLALLLAILWFFVPNNLRILFSEGNIPFVVVNCMLPYVLLYYYKALHEGKILDHIILAALMLTITLTHAMLAAMVGISLFILAAGDSLINRRYTNNMQILIYAFLGIMTSAFWLYPALKGGIMSLDQTAVASVMKDLTYNLKMSLNPLLRFKNIEIYYFGLAFAIAALFGLFFAPRKQLAPFAGAVLILLGTTKLMLPVLEQLPLNQLFWMSRFTSIAMAMIGAGLLLWKDLRKQVLAVITAVLIIDSLLSFSALGFNGQFPKETASLIDSASKVAVQRIAMLDSSQFGSFPSYYIKNQVFGWAWQGAGTSQNIMMLNTAMENGYYEFMFDRALELGADTLIVKKSLVGDYAHLEKTASIADYEKLFENDMAIIYKFRTSTTFGTKATYDGMAIGTYSTNIAYLFPEFEIGGQAYLDSYSFEELRDKKAVFLSGFKYKDKKKAEALVLKLSEAGVRVVIDGTGLNERFLGVTAEPITLSNDYGTIYYKSNKLQMKAFPTELSEWKTCFLSGIDNKQSYAVIHSRLLSYIGNKENKNITFVGLNLPYYTFLTKDNNSLALLEQALDMKSLKTPDRELSEITITRTEDTLNIHSEKENVIVPIAALDAFVAEEGSFDSTDNLVMMKSKELKIRIIYPYLSIGIMFSLLSLAFIIVLSIAIYRINRSQSSGMSLSLQ